MTADVMYALLRRYERGHCEGTFEPYDTPDVQIASEKFVWIAAGTDKQSLVRRVDGGNYILCRLAIGKLLFEEALGPEKTCSRCGELLPYSSFRQDRRSSTGRMSTCRHCLAQARRDR